MSVAIPRTSYSLSPLVVAVNRQHSHNCGICSKYHVLSIRTVILSDLLVIYGKWFYSRERLGGREGVRSV